MFFPLKIRMKTRVKTGTVIALAAATVAVLALASYAYGLLYRTPTITQLAPAVPSAGVTTPTVSGSSASATP